MFPIIPSKKGLSKALRYLPWQLFKQIRWLFSSTCSMVQNALFEASLPLYRSFSFVIFMLSTCSSDFSVLQWRSWKLHSNWDFLESWKTNERWYEEVKVNLIAIFKGWGKVKKKSFTWWLSLKLAREAWIGLHTYVYI